MTPATIKVVALAALSIFCMVQILGCCDDEQGELKDQYEKEGADFLGTLGKYRVALKKIRCHETDDGFFGGNRDELTISVCCGKECVQKSKSMEAGEVEEEQCPGDGIGGWPMTSMELECNHGEDVQVSISEDDDFSPTDGGSSIVKWEMIEFFLHMTTIQVAIDVGSLHWWDKLGDAFMEHIGICLTDFVPGGWAVRAMKMSKKSQAYIKTMKKGIKKYQRLQEKAKECGSVAEDDLGCVTIGDALDDIWSATCLSPTNGQYELRLEFTANAKTASMSLVLFLSLVLMLPL